MKIAYLVVCNYNYPTESVNKNDENGNSYREIAEGHAVFDKKINLPVDYTIVGEYVLKNDRFIKQNFDKISEDICFETLEPSEFRVYELNKA